MSLGLVVIGRNEGARLGRCLASARGQANAIVYVDSGSTDDSVTLARSFGADVVELDLATPFTAARARNEGFARLCTVLPDVDLVQFVDGDCELIEGWLPRAVAHLRDNDKTAVVCGRRRERYPEASVYNHLCDLEWNTPVGPTQACGGDALMRVAAFQQAGGYDPGLIAGEEPDLCFRLRGQGWQIFRLDADMTLHDAAMTRFGQWWKRNVRSGHAFAEAVFRHGSAAEPVAFRQVVSNVAWSMPAAWPLWPMLWWKIYRGRPDPAYATFIVLGKLPHLEGQIKFWLAKARGKSQRIIEYK